MRLSGSHLNLLLIFQQVANLFRFRMHILAHSGGLWFQQQFSLSRLCRAVLVCPLACFPDNRTPPHGLLSAGLRWGMVLPPTTGGREDSLHNVSGLCVPSFLQGVVEVRQHWFSIRGDVARAHLVITGYISDFQNSGSVLLASGGFYRDTAIHPIMHRIPFQNKDFFSPRCQ